MREETKKWLDKAERDIKTAQYNLEGNISDAAIFYAQQSTEKALKALLLKKTNKFPKIHDLIKLAKLVKAPKEIIELCSKINPSYIASRYPDQEDIYSKKESEEIIKFAIEVLKWIKKEII